MSFNLPFGAIDDSQYTQALSATAACAGGGVLEVDCHGAAAVLVAAGAARLRVDGDVVSTQTLGLLPAAPFAFRWYVSGTERRDYPVALEIIGGPGGTATPLAGCCLIACEKAC